MEWVQALGDSYLFGHKAEFEERYKSVEPDDYATISYTSGTTADPKGVLLTHRNYTANVEQAHSVIGVKPDSTMLIILPLDHCFAHVAGFYTMMSYCSSIATVPVGANPLATLRNIPIAIKEVRPHVMLSVPALARNFKKNVETTIHKQGPKRRETLQLRPQPRNLLQQGILQPWRHPSALEEAVDGLVRQDHIQEASVRDSAAGWSSLWEAARFWTSSFRGTSAPSAFLCSKATACPRRPLSSPPTRPAMRCSALRAVS